MIKAQELLDPNSCLNRAHDAEFVFSLLGRDVTTPATIRFWITERISRGLNKPDDPQITEALEAAVKIEEAQPFTVFTKDHALGVWQVSDYEWIAAASESEAIEGALREWGYADEATATREGAFEREDVQRVNLDKMLVNIDENERPDGERITAREHLKRMISAGEKFPAFFAGRD